MGSMFARLGSRAAAGRGQPRFGHRRARGAAREKELAVTGDGRVAMPVLCLPSHTLGKGAGRQAKAAWPETEKPGELSGHFALACLSGAHYHPERNGHLGAPLPAGYLCDTPRATLDF